VGKDVKIGIGVALCIGLLLFVFLVIRGGNPEKPVAQAAPATATAGPSSAATGVTVAAPRASAPATPPSPAPAQAAGGKWTTLEELELAQPSTATQERTAEAEIVGTPPKPSTPVVSTPPSASQPTTAPASTTSSTARAAITPAPAPSLEVTAPAAAPQTCTVAQGDTLWSLAVRFYGEGRQWKRIEEANRDVLTSAGTLSVGMVLVVPPKEGQRVAAESQVAAASQPPAAVAGMGSYTVERGDTLYSIARKQYGDASLWRVIYEANREQVPAPDQLRTGAVLVIPPASQK